MEKPKFRKSYLQLKQFDGPVIKVMGTFEETFKTKQIKNVLKWEMIPITVVACHKDHRLLGIDRLKVDATKLINSITQWETK